MTQDARGHAEPALSPGHIPPEPDSLNSRGCKEGDGYPQAWGWHSRSVEQDSLYPNRKVELTTQADLGGSPRGRLTAVLRCRRTGLSSAVLLPSRDNPTACTACALGAGSTRKPRSPSLRDPTSFQGRRTSLARCVSERRRTGRAETETAAGGPGGRPPPSPFSRCGP